MSSIETHARASRFVLASGSPRRRQLLGSLGLEFEVRPVEIDESVRPGEQPEPYVRRLALEKASERVGPGEVVLGADTIVVLDDEILGKPTSEAVARQVLERLAGRWHEVFTGVAVVAPGPEGLVSAVTVERTRVKIAVLTEQEIAWYVSTGEPLDKAGSYAIQGYGALLVDEIEGNYTNVVGLSLPATRRLVAEMGHELLAFAAGVDLARARPLRRRT